MTILNHTMIDPRYIQIKRKEAAQILGVSPAEFDRMRKSDPLCPKGHTRKDAQFARVFFRLSDVYAYSEALIDGAVSAISSTDDPCTNTGNHQLPKHHKE